MNFDRCGNDDVEKLRNVHAAYERSAFSEEIHSFLLPALGVMGIFCQIGQLIYQQKLGGDKDQIEPTYDKVALLFGICIYLYLTSRMGLRLVPRTTPRERFIRISWIFDECISSPTGLLALAVMNSLVSIPFAIVVGFVFIILLVI